MKAWRAIGHTWEGCITGICFQELTHARGTHAKDLEAARAQALVRVRVSIRVRVTSG